jgi:hypothetical protein
MWPSCSHLPGCVAADVRQAQRDVRKSSVARRSYMHVLSRLRWLSTSPIAFSDTPSRSNCMAKEPDEAVRVLVSVPLGHPT